MTEFKKGDRVKYSQRFIQMYKPKNPDRPGTVKGPSRAMPDCYLIQWDGNKSSGAIHNTFLEKVDA